MIAESPIPVPVTENAGSKAESRALLRGHLRFGWGSLLLFLSLGIALEALHALKLGFYLDIANDTRRLLWTLAHAHGTLLSLVHLGFALTVHLLPDWAPRPRAWASWCLTGATVLMPAGFFLGGVFLHGGDPGLGIALLPPGAALLLSAVVLTCRGARS